MPNGCVYSRTCERLVELDQRTASGGNPIPKSAIIQVHVDAPLEQRGIQRRGPEDQGLANGGIAANRFLPHLLK